MSLPNLILSQCTSTQSEAEKIIHSNQCVLDLNGYWIFAEEQLSGRGRLERIWVGGKGNLHLSIILGKFLVLPHWITWLPLVTALSVLEVIENRYRKTVQLKWPNDLIYHGKKLGGILCEVKQKNFIVCGVGCNFHSAPYAGGIAIGLDDEESLKVSPIIAEKLVEQVDKFKNNPDQLIYELKEKFWKYSIHQKGEAILRNGKKCIVLDLGPQGELLVEENGTRMSIFSDDIE